MSDKLILVINAGSSSLKFKLFDENQTELAFGIAEKIGQKGCFYDFSANKIKLKQNKRISSTKDAIVLFLYLLNKNGFDLQKIKKVGHRVVHGGEVFTKPTLINYKNIKKLEAFNKLAPLHNPNNVMGIKACLALLPQAKNFAVFDTSFHANISDYVALYPLPEKLYKKYKIRKYGFHGISHEYVTKLAGQKLKKLKPNLITCHLGSGCSITAVKNGRSVDTSMGFTPLEGLMMRTRSGDIDPAIIFYLKDRGYKLKTINNILNFESGLQGVSGLADMRDIMMASGYKVPNYKASKQFSNKDIDSAKLALDMFIYRAKKYIGSYYAILGKVDAIVFTAGMGERNKDIRDLILKDLPFKVKSLVIPTNEELMIAQKINYLS